MRQAPPEGDDEAGQLDGFTDRPLDIQDEIQRPWFDPSIDFTTLGFLADSTGVESFFTSHPQALLHPSIEQPSFISGTTPSSSLRNFSATVDDEQLNFGNVLDTSLTALLIPQSLDRGNTISTPSVGSGENSTLSVSLSSSSKEHTASTALSPLRIIEYSYSESRQKSEAMRNDPARPWQKVRRPRALAKRSNVLGPDKAPRSSIRKDASGKISGAMSVFGLDQVVRAPVAGELQIATAITRRIGACKKCNKSRVRCDMPESDYEPCGRCLRLLLNLRARNPPTFKYEPCLRIDIIELQLHRKILSGDLHTWVREKQEQLAYKKEKHTEMLFITQGFGEGFDSALCLVVSRFEPTPSDRTKYFWTDSARQVRSMEMPPYFISDMDATRRNIHIFLKDVRSTHIQSLLEDSNPLISQTFQAALVYTAFCQCMLISDALDIWVASRMVETHWRVFCNGEKIGLFPSDEPESPFRDFIPLTPMMDTQIDSIIINDIIAPLSNRFLKALKAKIDEQKRENWLEIYFAMFIMMSNVGWVTKDMMAMASFKGLKPGSRGGTLTQGFMHACKTMLSYFHFACAGIGPLSIDFDKLANSNTSRNNMTRGQVNYIEFLQEEIVRQEPKLSKWKELSMYEDDAYWCYQLLRSDWKGNFPHAGEIDDFSEDDFLSSSVS